MKCLLLPVETVLLKMKTVCIQLCDYYSMEDVLIQIQRMCFCIDFACIGKLEIQYI